MEKAGSTLLGMVLVGTGTFITITGKKLLLKTIKGIF